MKSPSPEKLAALRRHYTVGSRVQLIRMNDPYRLDLKAGALGTVVCVDDAGNIHVNWDCGSSLSVLYEIDACEVVHFEGSKTDD